MVVVVMCMGVTVVVREVGDYVDSIEAYFELKQYIDPEGSYTEESGKLCIATFIICACLHYIASWKSRLLVGMYVRVDSRHANGVHVSDYVSPAGGQSRARAEFQQAVAGTLCILSRL